MMLPANLDFRAGLIGIRKLDSSIREMDYELDPKLALSATIADSALLARWPEGGYSIGAVWYGSERSAARLAH